MVQPTSKMYKLASVNFEAWQMNNKCSFLVQSGWHFWMLTYIEMIQPTILAIWSMETPCSNDQDTYEYMNRQPIDPTHYTGNLKHRAPIFKILMNIWTYNQLIQPTILEIWSIEPPLSNDQGTFECMNLQPNDPTHYTGNLKHRAYIFKWSGHFWMNPTTKWSNPLYWQFEA